MLSKFCPKSVRWQNAIEVLCTPRPQAMIVAIMSSLLPQMPGKNCDWILLRVFLVFRGHSVPCMNLFYSAPLSMVEHGRRHVASKPTFLLCIQVVIGRVWLRH